MEFATLCPQCGASYSRKQRWDRLPFWLALLITLTSTVTTGLLLGWPWAILGTWMGWVGSTTFCGALGVSFLTAILMLLTNCVIGPLDALHWLPPRWHWLGHTWLVGGIATILGTLYFIRKETHASLRS